MAEAIVVKGIDELKRVINKFTNEIENDSGFNQELSSNLAQKASAVAPKQTGALASSIKGQGSNKKAQILAGGSGVPYAGVIEYGWPEKNIQAQPYLTTTVKNNMDYIVEQYEDNIKTSIKKYNLD